MADRTVREVIVPFTRGTPLVPAITPEARLVAALRLMADHGADRLAVVRGDRPIGMVRRVDVLRTLGLEEPC